MDDYLSPAELAELGLGAHGRDVSIHRTALLVNPGRLTIGSFVRIDAFTIITCGETACSIGDHVHISTHVFIAGRAGFDLASYVGVSSGCKLFSTTDDFAGDFLTGPTIGADLTNVIATRVRFGEHAVSGANSVVMPGGELGEGAILGALSLAKTHLSAWHIHAGVPAKCIKARSKNLLRLVR
jgi:acetyltransferase-like isoleucine patch superfamily enzyme